ncbi:hypothetical protein VTN96DRAFT_5023 [Rasamsonia emersonii]
MHIIYRRSVREPSVLIARSGDCAFCCFYGQSLVESPRSLHCVDGLEFNLSVRDIELGDGRNSDSRSCYELIWGHHAY